MPKNTSRATAASAQTEPAAVTPFEQALTALRELRQPWSLAVRNALGLLRRADAGDVCETAIVDFPYAKEVHKAGSWQCPQLPVYARHAAVGIVLKGRVEIVGLPAIPYKSEEVSGNFSGVRPWPHAVLRPGSFIGSYEFTSRLYQHPEAHEYIAMAGPVCLQFDHPQFCAFRQKMTGDTNHGNPLKELLCDGSKEDTKLLELWKRDGTNFNLVKALAAGSALKASHARILFIYLRQPELADDFRRSIVESAWSQSLALRRKSFRRDNLPGLYTLGLGNRSVRFLDGIIATIERIHDVLWSDGLVWSRPSSVEQYPAIVSFLNRLSSAGPAARSGRKSFMPPFDRSLLYFASTLNTSDQEGLITLGDHLHHYKWLSTAKGEPEDRLAWTSKKDSDLSHVAEDLTEYIRDWINKAPKQTPRAGTREASCWPASVDAKLGGETGSKQGGTPSANPFQRLQIRLDSGLKTLPILGIVEAQKLTGKKLDLSETLIVACQHLLRETCCWLTHLKETAGADIVVAGKDYSTCPQVAIRLKRLGIEAVELETWEWKLGAYQDYLRKKIARVWEVVAQRLTQRQYRQVLVIDDGGMLIESAPKLAVDMRGVEQTTSGLPKARKAAFPVVNVAGQRLKREYESVVIADAIIERTALLCPAFADPAACVVGVLGCGAIGAELIVRLYELKYRVFYHDTRVEALREMEKRVNTLLELERHKRAAKPQGHEARPQPQPYEVSCHEVVRQSYLVFGCTGGDALSCIGEDLSVTAGKWFASCGSMDTEFATLLKCRGSVLQRVHNPFSTVKVPLGDKSAPVHVLNGGCPVNFDREPDSVPLRKTQLTKGLMHAALIQAHQMPDAAGGGLFDVDFIDGRAERDLINLLD